MDNLLGGRKKERRKQLAGVSLVFGYRKVTIYVINVFLINEKRTVQT